VASEFPVAIVAMVRPRRQKMERLLSVKPKAPVPGAHHMHREPAPRRRWWVGMGDSRSAARPARASSQAPRAPCFASRALGPGGQRSSFAEQPDDPEHVRARDDAHGPPPLVGGGGASVSARTALPPGARASEKPMSYAPAATFGPGEKAR